MAYRFSRDDRTLEDALRRIATEELQAALAHLTHGPAIPPAQIHDTRKRIKKLRGLIRLFRPGFAPFDAVNVTLRDAGRALASQRDGDVRLATFDHLVGPKVPKTLQPLRARLVAEAAAIRAGGTHADEARGPLSALLAEVPDWHLEGRDRDVMIEGLAATRRKARAMMAAAADDLTDASFHDWRKRVKDLWYQARLLSPAWPEVLEPVATLAGTLGEDLGLHHDLAVLADHVAQMEEGTAPARARGDVASRAQRAQTEIEARVFTDGARLLAGRPRDVARLWTDWWQV